MPTLTKPIRVRAETREKYERISKAKRWKFVEVADAAIDALIEKDAEVAAAMLPRPDVAGQHAPSAA
jgi:hypothetical protein